MRTRRSVGAVVTARALLAALAFTGVARAQIAGENVNMVSGIQWPGGDPFLQRQNEPTLAVSSVNPQHLMAGANDYRSVDVPDPAFGKPIVGDAWLGVFKSLDGGQTWKSVLMPGYPQECSAIAKENELRAAASPPAPPLPVHPLCGYPAAADPVMRAGTDGLFYLGGINFLRDKTRSRLFVSRFIDDNDKENGSATGAANPAAPTVFAPTDPRLLPTDPIRYVDTVEVWSSERNTAAYPAAPTVFMDKPWIAVDIPRTGAACALRTKSGEPILAGTVYMAWAQFYPDDYQSDVMLSWSTDCGATWLPKPVKLNTSNSLANQGVTVAIEPVTGRVYVAWRRAAWANPKQTDAIMVTRSNGRQRVFSAPRAIANRIIPFDMANGYGRARTQTMPAMAISTTGTASWAHIAWAGRVASGGDSRIFLSTARIHPKPSGDDDPDDPEEIDDETRIVWTAPAIADATVVKDDAGNTFTRGHQYMPSLTFGQGRLMLFYYDTRLDHTVRLYKPVANPTDGKFHEEELAAAGDLLDPDGAATVFGPEVNDYAIVPDPQRGVRPHAWRHTVDVRVASLPWGPSSASGGALVSRFPLGIRGDETDVDRLAAVGWTWLASKEVWAAGFQNGVVAPAKLGLVDAQGALLREQQLQMNIPGFPMFKGGTAAFLGDYIDIQGPAFVPKPGGWAFNSAPAPSPVFHAVWTSNQDVRTPSDGDWTRYTPVSGLGGLPVLFDGGRSGVDQTPVRCDPEYPLYVGSRDQNVYTSRITEGLAVTSPQNVKLLAHGTPTSFVLAARNETALPMNVRVFATPTAPVAFPPPASAVLDYSFTPDFTQPVTSLCATIAPHGSVTRTLFAQLEGELALASTTLHVQVDEVKSCPANGDLASVVTTGRSGSLTLNPPVAFNALVQPDGAATPIADGEVFTISAGRTGFSSPNPTLGNPTLGNPTLGNPTLGNPTLGNPTLGNPTLGNVTLSNPTLGNPTLGNPTLGNPTLGNTALINPTLGNPTLGNASMPESTPWDWSQTITNTGNTTSSYHVKVVGADVDPAKPLQLILSRTYYTNGLAGCDLRLVPHDLVFVSAPEVQKSVVDPHAIVDPGATDPSVANATLSLAPGESAAITLRGFMPVAEFARVVGKVQTVPVPASVTPRDGVTYENYPARDGQPPLLKRATSVAVSLQPGLIAATVSPTAPSTQPVTGTVTFIRNDADVVGVDTLDGSGQARVSATTAVGDTITALYGGDPVFAPSASSTSLPRYGTRIELTSGSPGPLFARVTRYRGDGVTPVYPQMPSCSGCHSRTGTPTPSLLLPAIQAQIAVDGPVFAVGAVEFVDVASGQSLGVTDLDGHAGASLPISIDGTRRIRARYVPRDPRFIASDVEATLSLSPWVLLDAGAISPDIGWSWGVGGDFNARLAQTFTVTSPTARVAGIRLPVRCNLPDTLYAELQGVNAQSGSPDGVTIGSIAAPGTLLSTEHATTSEYPALLFSAPLPVNGPATLALVLSASGSCGVRNAPAGDPYPGGGAFFSSSVIGNAWSPFTPPSSNDLPFQVLLVP